MGGQSWRARDAMAFASVLLICLAPQPASAEDRWALIVAGSAGGEKYAEQMRDWRAEHAPDGEVRELERHAPEWDLFVPIEEAQPPISVSDHRYTRRTGVA